MASCIWIDPKKKIKLAGFYLYHTIQISTLESAIKDELILEW